MIFSINSSTGYNKVVTRPIAALLDGRERFCASSLPLKLEIQLIMFQHDSCAVVPTPSLLQDLQKGFYLSRTLLCMNIHISHPHPLTAVCGRST